MSGTYRRPEFMSIIMNRPGFENNPAAINMTGIAYATDQMSLTRLPAAWAESMSIPYEQADVAGKSGELSEMLGNGCVCAPYEDTHVEMGTHVP